MDLAINVRIREIRKSLHYTQAQVAELLSIKTSTYSQMERKGKISVDMAKRIADVLNADPNYIMFGEQKNNELDFSPAKPDVITVKNSQDFIEQIKKGEEQLVLTVNEKNIIKNFRSLKEEGKKEFLNFLQNLVK